jgi:hypothetical protein
MKEKLLAILNLLNVFGVKTSDKIKNITIILVCLVSLFNLQVNVNKNDYGYLNSDTTIVVPSNDSTSINLDSTFIDLLLTDSILVDSIK